MEEVWQSATSNDGVLAEELPSFGYTPQENITKVFAKQNSSFHLLIWQEDNYSSLTDRAVFHDVAATVGRLPDRWQRCSYLCHLLRKDSFLRRGPDEGAWRRSVAWMSCTGHDAFPCRSHSPDQDSFAPWKQATINWCRWVAFLQGKLLQLSSCSTFTFTLENENDFNHVKTRIVRISSVQYTCNNQYKKKEVRVKK